jgi:hypothetical protein
VFLTGPWCACESGTGYVRNMDSGEVRYEGGTACVRASGTWGCEQLVGIFLLERSSVCMRVGASDQMLWTWVRWGTGTVGQRDSLGIGVGFWCGMRLVPGGSW